MAGGVYNMLFLCAGNAARSILAEAIVNHAGIDRAGVDHARGARFRGFSAGSTPRGEVHPYALELLRALGMPTDDLRAKSWRAFAAPDAPVMDFVFTVCDQAAAEAPPAWPGTPMIAHWRVPDPAAATGTELERRYAFRQAFIALERRLKIFMSLRIEALDRMALQRVASESGADLNPVD